MAIDDFWPLIFRNKLVIRKNQQKDSKLKVQPHQAHRAIDQ